LGPARSQQHSSTSLGPARSQPRLAGSAAKQAADMHLKQGQDKTKLHRNNEICSPMTSSATNQTASEQWNPQYCPSHIVHIVYTPILPSSWCGDRQLQRLDVGWNFHLSDERALYHPVVHHEQGAWHGGLKPSRKSLPAYTFRRGCDSHPRNTAEDNVAGLLRCAVLLVWNCAPGTLVERRRNALWHCIQRCERLGSQAEDSLSDSGVGCLDQHRLRRGRTP